MFLRMLIAAAATAAVLAGPAAALTVNPSNDGSGGKLIFQLDNGNRLGLVGLQDVAADDVITLADLDNAVQGGAILEAYFNDPTMAPGATGGTGNFGAWVGSPDQYDVFTGGTIDLTSGGRTKFWDALWIEYDTSIVFKGTNNFGAGDTATLAGDPIAAVPLPTAGWMMLACVGLLYAAARRDRF